MTSDGRVAATISRDQLRKNDNAHELLFMIGENESLRNFPDDGFHQPQWWSNADQLQQMPDGNVDGTADAAPPPNLTSDSSDPPATSEATDTAAQASTGEDAIPRQASKEGTNTDSPSASANPHTNAPGRETSPLTTVIENGMEGTGGELPEEEEDAEDDVKWPSRAFRSIQWLIVQASAFWTSFPKSWGKYYTAECGQTATSGQLA
ncbi:hypothetical protein QFC22_004722 [Naganishia vaughanmartiniae]|uniref:Uncharacterized protein n=1 Tax=Naganishia vaughanmartiniae TaxID=1424756 RepID=A0ACC2X0K0_9TREE|nr:hypothetical protein QFC22_004722 [Naganishia vaughanmartiniae]